ncbi:MAG: hypothetical protein RL287_222 [Actinomycetota bacterium]
MHQAAWVIVSNRFSGKGRASARSAKLRELLEGFSHQVLEVNEETLEASQSSLREALSTHSPRGVLIVGGDGLVNSVVTLLHESQKNFPVVVVPEGTGNDFARTCGTFSLSDSEILDLIITREPERLDLLLINGRPCVEIAATGFDANVNRRANALKWMRGKTKYVIAMIQELSQLKPTRYRMYLDGTEEAFDAIFVAIANSASYGGGMRISPDSLPDDGVVEIAVLQPVGRFELLRVFPRVFSGTHVNHPKFRRYSGKQGRLEAQTSVFADGEDFGSLPIDFEVLPKALSVWCMK